MNMNQMHPLDVALLNGRGYVQGSQMIARAAQLAGEHAVLTNAKFTRLTEHSVLAVRAPAAFEVSASHIGSIEFSTRAGPVHFDLHESKQHAPAREGAEAARVVNVVHDGALSGQFWFDTDDGFHGVIAGLVSGVKLLHLAVAPCIKDVWFAGLRNLHVPVSGWSACRGASVSVRRLRVGLAGSRQLSLLRIALCDAGREPIAGVVSFSFREA